MAIMANKQLGKIKQKIKSLLLEHGDFGNYIQPFLFLSL